ncbi:MAG: hypothetical protein HOM27_06685 [Candidatus Marinimicrobia bacterium]|mgnify:FL=1|jgi:hypothetical protein|nr:hypothetical protein [Candidatus Neomarinimicrobiota bacterium]
MNFFLTPFRIVKDKTRPWRRRRYEVNNRLKELEKLARLNAEISAWKIKNEILEQPRYKDDKRLLKYGFKAYSQCDEDGIIQEIFQRIGVTNKTFLEIGVGDGLENNTLFLLLKGWKGVWIDGDSKNIKAIQNKFSFLQDSGRLRTKLAWIDKDNIDSLIQNFGLPQEVDLLSLDIDGNDYHVLENIVFLNPRAIVLEYNARLPPPVKWVMAYDQYHTKTNTDYFGASLKSFEYLLNKRGYCLVGCNISGVNAFFVRKDLVKEHFHSNCSAENHYEDLKIWLLSAFGPGNGPDFGPYEDN